MLVLNVLFVKANRNFIKSIACFCKKLYNLITFQVDLFLSGIVKEGKIPAIKIGKQLRFRKERLLKLHFNRD
ncbi:MAG: hypothetical protein DRG20_04290 [Deltaproteobacteria bacterium]|nr:MAG: hypothetical protein DRG20_04290 [Deltaproteobacteria bacterium]